VQIMYDIMGNRRIPEYELDWLPGYEGSRPVRIGNAAVEQLQLDVYGEVIDALHLALCEGIPPDRQAWSIQRAMLTFLESRWRDPDQGLWESRGAPQHFVHSKIMAWVAADRAIRTLRRLGLPESVDRWERLRDEIHREVCEKGFDPDRNTFTQYYGSKELDAALLLIPQVGFLPPDDPRVVGTIEAIERELCEGGLVRRYTTSTHPDDNVDGLPGHEGVFLACSFWLADDLAMIGRRQEAEAMFQRLLGMRNDVGLLSEEWDPRAGRQLGNTPQAFTHVALINTAHNLMGTRDAREARTGHPDVVREVVDVLGGDMGAD
jgi:GH15 family glucan-1,4-alpha-glucosidase